MVPASDQTRLMLDIARMLEDEINWLVNFVPSENGDDVRHIDNTLLAGHLQLIRTLLTCENVDKVESGMTASSLLEKSTIITFLRFYANANSFCS